MYFNNVKPHYYTVIFGGKNDYYTNEVIPYQPERTEIYAFSPFRTDLTPHIEDNISFGNEKERWYHLYLNKIDIIDDQINSNIINKVTINVNDEEDPENNGQFIINGDSFPKYDKLFNLGTPTNIFKNINSFNTNTYSLNINTVDNQYSTPLQLQYSLNLRYVNAVNYKYKNDNNVKTGLNPNILKQYFPDLVFEKDNNVYIDYIGVVSHLVNLVNYFGNKIIELESKSKFENIGE